VASSLTLLSYKLCRVAYRLSPYLLPSTLPKARPRQWIIVTGATDGIGKAFATYLTHRNYYVLAIGRSELKLASLKSELTDIATIRTDFSDSLLDPAVFAGVVNRLKEEIGAGEVKGIVNCVGSAHFSRYSSLNHPDIDNLHNTNINSLHFMLRLSQELRHTSSLKENQFFINLSSVVAKIPNKYSSIYSASKAYSSNLISAVSLEEKEVTFLDVQPWYVRTKMVSYRNGWDTVEP
jgi:short-subunit dehydrogenase